MCSPWHGALTDSWPLLVHDMPSPRGPLQPAVEAATGGSLHQSSNLPSPWNSPLPDPPATCPPSFCVACTHLEVRGHLAEAGPISPAELSAPATRKGARFSGNRQDGQLGEVSLGMPAKPQAPATQSVAGPLSTKQTFFSPSGLLLPQHQ